MQNFFVQANYRFSTNEQGRPSTLYFQDGAGNRGRYRRGHAQGEQLIHQGGQCDRIFISPTLKAQSSAFARGVFEQDWDNATYGAFMDRLSAINAVVQAGDPNRVYAGRASLNMHVGWHAFETDGNLVHCSAGTVMVADNTIAACFQGAGLNAYAGAWMVW
jgi:hypothetical protein